MTQEPKVSVIIPTYNRAGYVADAIRSVQAQPFTDWEVIVADDGSTDDTRQVVEAFGGAVRYLGLDHCGLPAVARNAALREARGEYVAFLDSDDLFLPDKLQRQVAALDDHADAALVYSDGVFFRDDPGRPTGSVLDGVTVRSGNLFPHLLRGNFLFVATLLVRRRCVDAVGRFDEDPRLRAVEDYDLWLRLAARHAVVYAPGRVAAVRRHEGSISRDEIAVRERVLLVLRKIEVCFSDLSKEHRAVFREAYARNHAALALCGLRQGRVVCALRHAWPALGYLLRSPGRGVRAFKAWRANRLKRLSAHP